MAVETTLQKTKSHTDEGAKEGKWNWHKCKQSNIDEHLIENLLVLHQNLLPPSTQMWQGSILSNQSVACSSHVLLIVFCLCDCGILIGQILSETTLEM